MDMVVCLAASTRSLAARLPHLVPHIARARLCRITGRRPI
jgi:hypothetical protein